jgi:hypothetical protein
MVLRLTSETVQTGPNEQETLIQAETKPSNTRQCKDRDGFLPTVMLTPTLTRIHDYVNGKITEATDPEIKRHAEVRAKAAAYKASKRQRAA